MKKIKIDKNSLYDLYIIENKTVYEIAETLNCGIATINRLLKKFGIKKDISLRNQKIKETINLRTEEEKLEISQSISKAVKGKHNNQIPWNKGLHCGNGWLGKKHSEETKKKISETKLNKSKEEKEQIEAKRKESRGEVIPWNKGKQLGSMSEELKNQMLAKQYETKKKNNSFNTSTPEDNFYDYLVEKFSKNDIIRQYSTDKRYPFNCDFYIKSLDLFIELNFNWTHGGHKFDANSQEDLKKLEDWQEKALTSDYYKNAIETWVVRDQKKYETAKLNNLNYLVFYNESEINI